MSTKTETEKEKDSDLGMDTNEGREIRYRALLTDSFIRIAQNIGVIVGVLALIISPFWHSGVTKPMSELQNRVDKIEIRIDSVQLSNQSIDKNVAVMAQKLTNMEQLMMRDRK